MINTPIAYLTMTHKPMLARNAVINAIQQSYQNDGNCVYLIHQEKQAYPIDTEGAIKVVESVVEGKWASLFMQKIGRFLDLVKEPVTVIWDEDDRFEYGYVLKALIRLANHEAAYNYWNIFVDAKGFHYRKHRECWGTMVVKTDVLREAHHAASRMYPKLVKIGGEPLDSVMRKIIMSQYDIIPHNGVRYFFQWDGASTRRDVEVEIHG